VLKYKSSYTARIFKVTELFSCWVPANVKSEEPTRRPSLTLVKGDWRKLRKEEDQDFYCSEYRGRDSSVGIVTRYGLDCPRIESRYGRIFLSSSRPALQPTLPPVRCAQCHCRGSSGRGLALPPIPCSAEVKVRVGLIWLVIPVVSL